MLWSVSGILYARRKHRRFKWIQFYAGCSSRFRCHNSTYRERNNVLFLTIFGHVKASLLVVSSVRWYNSREVIAMRDVGKNIKQIRLSKNMTQDSLVLHGKLYQTTKTGDHGLIWICWSELPKYLTQMSILWFMVHPFQKVRKQHTSGLQYRYSFSY